MGFEKHTDDLRRVLEVSITMIKGTSMFEVPSALEMTYPEPGLISYGESSNKGTARTW